MNQTIFISGIHGVGKTTICWNLAEKMDIEHIVASDIIKQYNFFYKENKTAKDLYTETDIFLGWMKKIFTKPSMILLDAHFILLDSWCRLVKVKKEIFSELRINNIILLIDNVEKIQEKIYKRDGKRFDMNFLKKLQDLEIEYSKEIAKMLNVEHQIFNLSEISEDNLHQMLFNYIQNYVRTNQQDH